MKIITCLSISIFLLSCAASRQRADFYKSPRLGNIQRIAIAPFGDAPGILAKGSGASVADMLVTQLLILDRYRVVERSQIERVLREQGLWQSGVIEAGTAQNVGRMVGVQAVMIGSVTEYELRKGHVPLYVANVQTRSYSVGLAVRIVEVETGDVLFSSTGRGKGDSYYTATEQACRMALEPL